MAKKNKERENYDITDDIFDKCLKLYFEWKKINDLCEAIMGRKINMPEALSESIVCYLLGYKRNMKDTGDATAPDGKKIEIKAATIAKDLSSFGPKEKFDNCIFAHFFPNEDMLYIYDLNLNYEEMGRVQANKTNTVEKLRSEGKRPHFTIVTQIIEKNNLKPIVKYDLKARKKLQED